VSGCHYIGDQFIEPCGFSGSLPLLLYYVHCCFIYVAEKKLVVVVVVIVTLVLYCTVSEILQVFLCSWVTPPLFHPNFKGVAVAPDRPCWGQPAHRP